MAEGKKYDSAKIRTELLYKDLVNELEDIAKVLTFGAKKYDARNWQNLDNGEERFLAALIRHVNSYMKGERLDPESGLPHLAHAGCCLLFASYFQNNKSSYKVETYTLAEKQIKTLDGYIDADGNYKHIINHKDDKGRVF